MRGLYTAVLLFLIVGCGLFSHSEPVEYELAVRQGQQLALLDLETGRTRVIADSCYGLVRISPDGERIAISGKSRRNPSLSHLYVLNTSGQGERRRIGLIEKDGRMQEHMAGTEGPFVWSPDGSLIAFMRCLDCELFGQNTEIYLADSATRMEITQLTDNPYSDRPVDWAPNGEFLSIVSRMKADGTYDSLGHTYEIRPDGSDRHPVGAGVYSPDGTQKAYVVRTHVDDPDGYQHYDWEIFIANLDGSSPRRITHNNLREFDLSWSPDGGQIAFVGGPMKYTGDGWLEQHIWVVGVTTGQQRQVTHGAPVFASPDWFPIPVKR